VTTTRSRRPFVKIWAIAAAAISAEAGRLEVRATVRSVTSNAEVTDQATQVRALVAATARERTLDDGPVE
jgi:hypothetical protein